MKTANNSEIYNFKSIVEQYKIIIPKIQRDYAQGRNDQKTAIIRNDFLNAIKESLNKGTQLHLDFVYGTIKEGDFIPLDGQQRLTTLFLLHLYFSKRVFENFQHLKNFSYETRASSREFCVKIVEEDWGDFDYSTNISSQIKDCSWFMPFWENDPTIKSLLNMLDAINDKFNYDGDYQTKLDNLDNIKFSFLPIENFGLSDDLYIKMNSRGKLLSDFENFKSKILDWFENKENKQLKYGKENFKLYFSRQIDNAWTDIFWSFKDEQSNIDDKFLVFFENTLSLFELCNGSKNDNFEISKYKIQKEHLEKITMILDKLIEYKDELLKCLRDDLHIFSNYIKTKDSGEKKTGYTEKALFYALICYFLKAENFDNIKPYMRVCINIVNNTIFNSIDDLINVINIIDKLSESIKDIYTGVQELENRSGQVKEEQRKAKLIQNNLDFEDLFIDIEKHWYLDGQIGFLLDIANDNFNDFEIYATKFCKIWDYAKDSKNKQTLIQRSLLTLSFENELGYIEQTKHGDKYTFCTFGAENREKNENWRRVFNNQQLLIKNFLDKIDQDEIEKSLWKIIKNHSFDVNDWKSYIINPQYSWSMLTEIRNYQIRYIKYNDICDVYLNKGGTGVISWGWYKVAEFYTYYIYMLLREKGICGENDYHPTIDTSNDDTVFIENDTFNISWHFEKNQDVTEELKIKFKNSEPVYKNYKNIKDIVNVIKNNS